MQYTLATWLKLVAKTIIMVPTSYHDQEDVDLVVDQPDVAKTEHDHENLNQKCKTCHRNHPPR